MNLYTRLYLYGCHSEPKTDYITAFMHDAAFAWAHAANKTLEQGVYPTPTDMRQFGRTVVRNLNNLEFDGESFLAFNFALTCIIY